MRGRKGFSLVEAMVVLVLMVLIMSSVYLMIMYYRDVSGTEQARVRQSQESRYLLSVFSSELKNSGSVLTLINSGGFLSAIPNFNGIYPLNNIDFPDGVILASADPMAVTKLTAEFTPGTTVLKILTVNLPPDGVAPPAVAWHEKDLGLIMRSDGYYVFRVTVTPGLGDTQLAVRNTAVYYSGLLNTVHYDDPETTLGNAVTYPVNAPVMRLSDFSIYLVNERLDAAKGRNVRELVRVSDCDGKADVLIDADPNIIKGVITENVWDLQLAYTAFPDFAGDPTNKVTYFNGGAGTLDDLLTAIRAKTMKEITVSVVALTDDYPGKGKITYQLPAIADHPATANSLPSGKFNYKIYSFLVELRNFNIKI